MPTQAAQSILDAHKNGTLLAHMFEFTDLGNSEKLQSFLDVLSGKKPAEFKNPWHSVAASSEGYRGLATTALKKDIPVRLWDLEAGVGLLFDIADEQNTKPIHISSSDANTSVKHKDFDSKKRILRLGEKPERKEFTEMARIQGEDTSLLKRSEAERNIHLSDKIELQRHITAARLALPAFWDQVENMGWKAYVKTHDSNMPGVNEVSAIAHMRGVKGIIVGKIPKEDEKNKPNTIVKNHLLKRINEAKAIRSRLLSEYEGVIPQDLPILIYDATAKSQFHELTPEELQNPEEYCRKQSKQDIPLR